MMTRHERAKFTIADWMNSQAGTHILAGRYRRAAELLTLAAAFAVTPEGAAALEARALECQLLAHPTPQTH